jgi:hypothetical protein
MRATATLALPRLSQKSLIFNHMQRHGSITQLQALELYRVHRLASRIYDLRVDGKIINGTTKADATGRSYKSYSLVVGALNA